MECRIPTCPSLKAGPSQNAVALYIILSFCKVSSSKVIATKIKLNYDVIGNYRFLNFFATWAVKDI